MATDPRIPRALKALREGNREAQRVENLGGQRSTVSRNVYKAKATAADRALEILSERPSRRR